MGINFNEATIESVLDKALADKTIIPYFQPQYNAITGKVVSAEALARWINDDGSLIPPDNFVPILEKSCLITKLDWCILRQTCEFIKKQIDTGVTPVTIAVNFSRAHTYEPHFIDKLCSIVDGYEIPRKYIKIEITESVLAKGKSYIIDFIDNISKAGFEVAIDDFGSGLSSLNFVKDVPAKILKIDKSLLSGNCENTKERIVLESIFDFAHRLKLTTVAEGVETKEQLGFLRTCGCELIQGYYFSKPLPEEKFAELFSKDAAPDISDDILVTQGTTSAKQLLLDAVFMCYPLIILSNLTRNSFYMMVYDDFSTTCCPSTGVYDELIQHGAATMYPDDRELFANMFDIQDQIDAYNRGERKRRVVTRQLGDDGIYRRTETINYYVKNPSSDDLLAVTLSKVLEDDK